MYSMAPVPFELSPVPLESWIVQCDVFSDQDQTLGCCSGLVRSSVMN